MISPTMPAFCLCGCGRPTQISSRNRYSRGVIKGEPVPYLRGHGRVVHRMSRTATNRIWRGMIGRCENKNDKRWKDYGGRGIKVCERWRRSFSAFLLDMGERPEGMSIDRYPDQNGNYEPGNCRWATAKQQLNNMRRNHLLEFGGTTLTISQWADLYKLPYRAFLNRISRGWNVDRALHQPLQNKRRLQ